MSSQEHVTNDQQTWRVVAHASTFIKLVGISSIVGPLVVRRDDPVVEPHARNALNFQLSVLIFVAAGAVIAFVAALTIVGILLTVLIVILLLVLFVLELVFALLGTLAASRGERYACPMSLDLIRAR